MVPAAPTPEPSSYPATGRERRVRPPESGTGRCARAKIFGMHISDRDGHDGTGGARGERPDPVPPVMRVGAAWSWRFLVIAAAIGLIGFVLAYLSNITIPIAVALLLAALLQPVKDFLVRKGMRPNLAAPLVFVTGVVVVFGIVTAVVQQFIVGAPELAANAADGLARVRSWIVDLGVSQERIDSSIQSVEDWLHDNEGVITSGAATAAAEVAQVLAGLAITLFTVFFFLRDGRRIVTWILGLTPAPARPHLAAAADRAWTTLRGYVVATVLVAAVDAIGIGIVIAIVGVPLVIPLAALVFLTSFIPLVGATLSGMAATLVALVAVGPVGAIIVLIGVLVVQQLEGHFLQPVLMGRAVRLHPLAIVLTIAAGGLAFGITGALFAVPVVATLNAAIKQLRGSAATPAAVGPPRHGADDDGPEPSSSPHPPAG